MENTLLTEKKKSFELYDAALATILFIVFNFAFSFIYSMIPKSVRANDVVYFLASFTIEALFAVAAYVVARARKTDFLVALGARKKINSNCIFYGIIISFACLLFFSRLTNVFLNFLGLCGYSSVLGDLEINNFGTYLVYVLVSCVTPAVCEEFLFRGTIASGFKKLGFKTALIASSLIFTFMHGNPEQTVHQFIIGIVVGYIFLKTSNIWLGIIIHFMNNFVAVTMTYANSFISDTEVAAEAVQVAEYGWGSLAVDLVISVVIAAIGFFLVQKLITAITKESDKINGVEESKENSTIKVDGDAVAIEMSVDGEPTAVETEENESGEVKVEEKPKFTMSIVIMFVVSAAFFAIEWLTALLSGLGVL